MRQTLNRGLWLAKIVLLSAALVGVLLSIDKLRHSKLELELNSKATAQPMPSDSNQ